MALEALTSLFNGSRQRRAEWARERRTVTDEAVTTLAQASRHERDAVLAANPSITNHSDVAGSLARLDADLNTLLALRPRVELRWRGQEVLNDYDASLSLVQHIRNELIGLETDRGWETLDAGALMNLRVQLNTSMQQLTEHACDAAGGP